MHDLIKCHAPLPSANKFAISTKGGHALRQNSFSPCRMHTLNRIIIQKFCSRKITLNILLQRSILLLLFTVFIKHLLLISLFLIPICSSICMSYFYFLVLFHSHFYFYLIFILFFFSFLLLLKIHCYLYYSSLSFFGIVLLPFFFIYFFFIIPLP